MTLNWDSINNSRPENICYVISHETDTSSYGGTTYHIITLDTL